MCYILKLNDFNGVIFMKKIVFTLLFVVTGISMLTTFKFHDKKQNEKLIFKSENDIRKEKNAYIKSVYVISESCSNINYKINYINHGKEEGYYRVLASSIAEDKNYEGFRGDNPVKLKKEIGQISYSEWITAERSNAKTNEIWVSIEHIKDNKFHSIKDRVKISYPKKWDHECSQ